MNKKDFEKFVHETEMHNWGVEKTDNPMTFSTLVKYATRNKNKPVFLYYEDDLYSDKISSYYEVDYFGCNPGTLKSVKSIFVSDSAIILSYIPQLELSRIHFDFDLLNHTGCYTTTDEILTAWHHYKKQNHGSTSIIAHYNVYIQYIEDDLGWTLIDGKKLFQSFSFSKCGVFLSRGVYFTPHY